MGSVLPFLGLTDQERQVLEGYCRKGTTEHRLVQRAEVILAVATGTAYRAVARQLGQARNTVRKWSRRFAANRLAGVQDRPRAGRPPVFSAVARTQIVGLACRAPGDEGCTNDNRWTLDLLVETALRQGIVPAIHRATVARLLVQGEIKPHRLVCPARGRVEFLTFMNQLAARYPTGRVHCVLDNLNTHFGPEVDAWLKAHDHRFVFHFTPIHASWVNQIEVWFSILSRKLLRGASFSTLDNLEARITAFIDDYNSRASPFKWTWKGYPLVA